jgi:small subunit ribosomal protein S16
MVKIRLRRMGAKKAPFYRIVVADARSPRDGRFIEQLGYYDPTKDPAVVHVDQERALYWMDHGAQPTDTVRSLLRRTGVLREFALRKKAQRASS